MSRDRFWGFDELLAFKYRTIALGKTHTEGVMRIIALRLRDHGAYKGAVIANRLDSMRGSRAWARIWGSSVHQPNNAY